MQAYEFYATPENGTIQIPDQYKEKITSSIKVIILDEKPRAVNRDKAAAWRKSDFLLPPSLDTKGWKFDREEANEL